MNGIPAGLLNDAVVRSLLDIARLENLWMLTDQACAASKTGAIVEFGCYKGGSAQVLYNAIGDRANTLHLFDTFGGMPIPGPNDGHKTGDLGDTSFQVVRDLLPHAILHIGDFRNRIYSIPALKEIAFAHIDVDLETSTECALWIAFKGLRVEGWIVVDDYNADGCRGAKLATDRFLGIVKTQVLAINGPHPSLMIQRQY